jgi:CubicO group peptidase (beta-lactamase class C family)
LIAALERGIGLGLHRGAQVAVSGEDGVTKTYSVGTTRSGRPVDAETQFPWACASKLVGVLALGGLVSDRRLAFETALRDVLPELDGSRLGRITLADVVTHRTGISLDIGYEPFHEAPDRTLQRLAEHLESVPDPATAGAAYLVWSGWFLVGQVVERVTATTYADHTAAAVLQPLGALRTVTARADVDLRNAVAFEMGRGDDAVENPLDQGVAGTRCVPGYSLCGPASDLAAVLSAFVVPDRCEAVGISVSTMTEICRTRRSGLPDTVLGWAPDWGLGVATDPKMWRGHGGLSQPVGHVGIGGAAIAVADRRDRRTTVALFGRSIAAFAAAGRSRMTLQWAAECHETAYGILERI